ncbi:hypothetical protein TRFO_19174 [Tritrichomonas foetus]|uniref:Uncharacterized protein n=1 Tax=Tritrichomonas foetus TaxID=1144522 RepID=A0A1J4KNK2_9EUKA|nr:hypothetical protein TRFO_19174 [Tritrichomonas foetus]|eukprot:OHT11372.1 hypothetical protein TRFO_19174 [Tritrichomonas foetus]
MTYPFKTLFKRGIFDLTFLLGSVQLFEIKVAVMNEQDFKNHLSQLNVEKNIMKLERQNKQMLLDLLTITHQIKIENFFSSDFADLLKVDFVEIINLSKRTPQRIHNFLTGMNSGIVLDWLILILQNPEKFAIIVVDYFRTRNEYLSYFAAITFPSIFHHFFTNGFQKLSYRFLISMLESGDIGTFWYFCLSFIESTSNFSLVLWENFLNFELSVSSISDPSSKMSGPIFYKFLKCLKSASCSLSIYQHSILKKFNEVNSPTCALFVCKYLIERSFNWFHLKFNGNKTAINSRITNRQSIQNIFQLSNFHNEITKILDFSSQHPNSPQFKMIIHTLTVATNSRFVADIVGTHSNLIICQHDCYLIQDIIKKSVFNEELKENTIRFVKIFPVNKESIKNFVPMSLEIPLNMCFKKKELTPGDTKTNQPGSSSFSSLNNNDFHPKPISKQPDVTRVLNMSNNLMLDTHDEKLLIYDDEKFEYLLKLGAFKSFVENEISKRKYEQIRSHYSFTEKLLQSKKAEITSTASNISLNSIIQKKINISFERHPLTSRDSVLSNSKLIANVVNSNSDENNNYDNSNSNNNNSNSNKSNKINNANNYSNYYSTNGNINFDDIFENDDNKPESKGEVRKRTDSFIALNTSGKHSPPVMKSAPFKLRNSHQHTDGTKKRQIQIKDDELSRHRSNTVSKNKKIPKQSSFTDFTTLRRQTLLINTINMNNFQRFTNSVGNLIEQVDGNETKFLLYCLKLNEFDYHYNDKMIPVIVEEYVKLMNTYRIRKLGKYTKLHPDWKTIGNKISNFVDFMCDYKIGTCIIWIVLLGEMMLKVSEFDAVKGNENKFFCFVLMNSKSDCFIRIYMWIKKIFYSISDLRKLLNPNQEQGIENIEMYLKKIVGHNKRLFKKITEELENEI